MASNASAIPFFTDDTSLTHFVLAAPHPFYYTPHARVLPSLSDETLALLVPLLAYWLYAGFFHILDVADFRWLDAYRIHDSAEVKSRNLATKSEVLRAVLFQQVVQTALGWCWMGVDDVGVTRLGDPRWIRDVVSGCARGLLGQEAAEATLRAYGPAAVRFLYWWGIPTAQLVFGMFCIDTWQYFLHRFMHTSKFLYRSFHSWHHRLYVPYAFGALYNHPVEGLLLDTASAGLAQFAARMGPRQAAVLFALSTLKTIDDHCGYRLPLDPLQMLFGNNADYHDIHHQIVGIKSNFAQPFFVHWDTILGTRLTREEVEKRKTRVKAKDL